MSKTRLLTYLRTTYEQRRSRNPKYSLRAYAQSLGIDSSTLSAILAGKRPITAKRAVRILERLDIKDARLRSSLLDSLLLPEEPPARKARRETAFDMSLFSVVRDWEHSALLAALEINPRSDVASLAKKFGLDEQRVSDALARLEGVGLIRFEKGRWLTPTEDQMSGIPREIPSADLRECHRQFLQKATDSLSRDSRDIRSITGTTLTLNPEKLAPAKDLILDFQRRILALVDDGKASRVYRLNVQLFPLEKGNER